MKPFLLQMLLLVILQGNHAEAASIPLRHNYTPSFSDSTLKALSSASILQPHSTTKKNFIEKLQYKVIEKKLKRYLKSSDAKATQKGHVLSTVSLVIGIIGAIFLFVPNTFGIAFLLSIVAVITGIIYLSKDEKTKGGKTKALIGLILGVIGAVTGLAGLFLMAIFGGFQ